MTCFTDILGVPALSDDLGPRDRAISQYIRKTETRPLYRAASGRARRRAPSWIWCPRIQEAVSVSIALRQTDNLVVGFRQSASFSPPSGRIIGYLVDALASLRCERSRNLRR
jgi:hypothetical protein